MVSGQTEQQAARIPDLIYGTCIDGPAAGKRWEIGTDPTRIPHEREEWVEDPRASDGEQPRVQLVNADFTPKPRGRTVEYRSCGRAPIEVGDRGNLAWLILYREWNTEASQPARPDPARIPLRTAEMVAVDFAAQVALRGRFRRQDLGAYGEDHEQDPRSE